MSTYMVGHVSMPLEERLTLALVEDCETELDETDIANVVKAVLPVIRRLAFYRPVEREQEQ